jgi:pimeloyl-ACP methyl ester carboxylesterase
MTERTDSPSIYRSSEAQAAIRELYDRARIALPMATDSRMVPTRFGETHVLLAGPADGQPLVIFGGGNVVGPLTLGWFTGLASTFRLIAPDTIGQPGLSAGTRVSGRDASLGEWALDVLEAMQLDQVRAVGISYGAGVLLRLAEVAPERITSAALVVPSGLTGSPIGAMLRLAAGYGRYRLRPSRAAAASVTKLLSHREPDPLMVESVELSFGGTRLETDMPRLAQRADLARFRAPVLVAAAEHDPLFPPKRVLPAARALFDGVETAVITDSGHILSPDAAARLTDRLAAFFSR